MVSVCFKCNITFRDSYTLQRHLNRKIPCCQPQTKCNQCMKTFSSKQSLMNHMNKKIPCQNINININNGNIITNNINIINTYHINNGEKEYKTQMMCQIVDQFKIYNCKLLSLLLSNGHDNDDAINNINDFTNLINIICFDINHPENWRFIYDKMTELLKIKFHNEIVDFKCNFLKFVYILYKQICNCQLVLEMDPELINFYKRFINEYEMNKYDELDINEFINECHDQLLGNYHNLVNAIDKRLNNKEQQKIKTTVTDYRLNLFDQENLKLDNNIQIQNTKLIKHLCKNGYEYDFESDAQFEYKLLKCTYNDIIIYDVFIHLFKVLYIYNKCNKTIKYSDRTFKIYQEDKERKRWIQIDYKKLLESIFNKINKFIIDNEINLTDELYNEYRIHYIEHTNSDSDTDSDSENINNRKYVNTKHLKKYKRIIQYILTDNEFTNMINYPN